MNLTLDLKQALYKNKNAKVMDEHGPYSYAETNVSKAKHILGLDTTYGQPGQNRSTSSTSTNRIRSVTFSDATTARATSPESCSCDKDVFPALSRKSSSPFSRKIKKSDTHTVTLNPKLSESSLRSCYDKNLTPLSVSQQTSESSSRDFALRKGTPSVINVSSQGTEHSRQVRLIAKLQKPDDRRKHISSVPKLSNSSSRSIPLSNPETNSDTAESRTPQQSASRISIVRNVAQEEMAASSSGKTRSGPDHPFPMVKTVVDPARAKVNVRRPKAGTKNWFDSLESDSSDDEGAPREIQLPDDFALEVANALQSGKVIRVPPRGSSQISASLRDLVPAQKKCGGQHRTDLARFEISSCAPSRKRKVSMFENVDLTKQSVLCLESSDDEDNDQTIVESSENGIGREAGCAVMNSPWDDAQIELGSTHSGSTGDSERILQQLESGSHQRPPIPRRASGRKITYLDDCSTETVTQHDNLITSFPPTPTDIHSRTTSWRGSILSENESVKSTKLMTVTRQEESLIAAMRLKKAAMKRAQVTAHRQGALNILERENMQGQVPSLESRPYGHHDSIASRTPFRRPDHRSSELGQRTDSVTTFQTDSIRRQSARSSIATYLSEGSEDLQLPYSPIHGLPIGSSRVEREESVQSGKSHRGREMSLSDGSTTPGYNAPPGEWSPNVRDSHVVELDPLSRQVLRGEIPSQLFLERPFLGWEVQVNVQTAH